jgi:competence protein ComEA
MWSSSRQERQAQLRRRLTTVAASWVPTPEAVQQELAGVGPPDGSVDWDDAAPPPQPRRVERGVLPAVVLVVVGAVVGASVLWLMAWPRGAPVPAAPGGAWPSSVSPGTAVTPAGGPTDGPATVVVDVAGAVRRPGVVELPAGSRVIDAVSAAGGTRTHADTTTVNLARVLVDGEQVVVPGRGQQGSPSSALSPVATPGATSPVDLNTATLEQLDALPGIGPVLAQRIIDWRTANGGFSTVDQLREVSGIGDATFADLEPLVDV